MALDGPLLKAVVDAVVKLQGGRGVHGDYADWELLVICDEPGMRLKTVVVKIDDYQKVQVKL